jgi:DNA-binding PadR family transcriptional regulator
MQPFQTLALRIGLASHPTFAGAIHERLVLDVMSDVPTGRPSLEEIRRVVADKFGGIDLTAPQMQVALRELTEHGWLEAEGPDRTGVRRYFMTLQGQEQWSQARREGRELEARVRDEFCHAVPGSTGASDRWDRLLAALDGLFAREALRIAQTVLESGRLDEAAEDLAAGATNVDDDVRRDLHDFLEQATGDRAIFVRRLLHGALAFHLFRATPEADEAVLRHLRGRTLFLDTTVLYALVAEEGELASLGRDLTRIAQALESRLEVTTQTLTEFQESVAHYKEMLTNRGITDAGIARAVMRQSLDELDDFRRGYYRALIQDPRTEIDSYSLRYETVEERLPEWGITRPRPIPEKPVKGPNGSWLEVENVQSFEDSLGLFLEQHPRRVLPKDDRIRRALIHHDALHVAWVAHERSARGGVRVPTRASQVDRWFLTRDRAVADWDRRFVEKHGPGRVPRCLSLEEWIESVAVFVPTARDSEALSSLVLRLVALGAPSIQSGDDLNAEDMQRIGRVAQSLKLNPDEAARLVADRTLQEQLDRAASTDRRIAAVKDGVLRLREEQLDSMGAQLELFKEQAGKLPDLKRQVEAFGKERTEAEAQVTALSPDAELGRRLRERGTWAALAFVAVAAVCVGLVSLWPSLWVGAGVLRRMLVTIAGISACLLATMLVLGFARRAKTVLAALLFIAGSVATVLELWDRSEVSSAAIDPPSETGVPEAEAPRVEVDSAAGAEVQEPPGG